MAFTLTSNGLRKLGGSVKFATLAAGATASGVMAARMENKSAAAIGSVVGGLVGVFVLPNIVPADMKSPNFVGGFSEGLLAGGAAQAGALMGEKYLK